MSLCLSQHSSASSGVGEWGSFHLSFSMVESTCCLVSGKLWCCHWRPLAGHVVTAGQQKSWMPCAESAHLTSLVTPWGYSWCPEGCQTGSDSRILTGVSGPMSPTETQRIITGKKTSTWMYFRNHLVPSSPLPGGKGNWGRTDGQPAWGCTYHWCQDWNQVPCLPGK